MQKNNEVGTHAIDYLLACGHMGEDEIAAMIYSPKIGDARTCPTCHTQQSIIKLGSPYWKDKEEK